MVDPVDIATGPGWSLIRWVSVRLTPHWRATREVENYLRNKQLGVHRGQLRHALRESHLRDVLLSGDSELLANAVARLHEVPLRDAGGTVHDGELLAAFSRLAYTRTSDTSIGLTISAVDSAKTHELIRQSSGATFEAMLQDYPVTFRDDAIQLRSALGEPAARVVRELRGAVRLQALRDWSTTPPSWLPEDAGLYTWLGDLTQATSSHDGSTAAIWYSRAIDSGGSPRAYLKLKRFYAYGVQNDERFRAEFADHADHPLVKALGPNEAPDTRAQLLGEWEPATASQGAFLSAVRTQILDAQGDYDLAVGQGIEAYEKQGHLSAGLNAAESLLRRSFTDPQRTHSTDVSTALAVASRIRTQQIAWGLDSGRALAIAVRAQMALANADAAWALVAPTADVTPQERQHGEVREMQVVLLVELGRIAEAREIADETFPRRLRLQIDAREAELALETEKSAQLWAEVVDATEDLTEKAGICLRLALLGHVHPWVATMAELNSELADDIQLIADLFTGSETAEQRARAAVQENMRVAHALVARYKEAGRIADVAHFAERAAEKWNIADDWLSAAISRLRLDELDSAAKLANRAIAAGGPDWGDRERARLVLIETAFRSRNWVEAILAAEQLLADNPDHEDARWALMFSHAHAAEIGSAYRTFAAHPVPLRPRSPVEAALWLDLFHDHGTRMAPVSDAMEIVRHFSDHSAIRAKAVPTLLLAPLDDVPADFSLEPLLQELQEKYPDDAGFQVLSGLDTTRPEELLDRIDQMLGPRPDLSSLEEALGRGTMPIGAATMIGKSYVEVLIRSRQRARFAGPLPDIDEVTAARSALTGPVVADTTALVTIGLLGTEHSAMILPRLPKLRTAVEQLIDATGTQRAGSMSSEITFVPSTESTPRAVIATDAETLRRDADLLSEVIDLFRQTERTSVPSSLPESLRRLEDLEGSWTAAIMLAAATDAPLWCDDAATRRLALDFGVDTFGTPALLQALEGPGIAADVAAVLKSKLIHEYTVGIPFDRTVYELALDLDGWHPLGTAVALRHSGVSSLPEKLGLFHEGMKRTASEQPGALRDWARLLGEFVTGLDVAERRASNQTQVTRMLLTQRWMTPAALPFVADGLTRAFKEDWPDVLETAVRELRRSLITMYGHASASSFLLTLLKGLPEVDHQRAVGVILER